MKFDFDSGESRTTGRCKPSPLHRIVSRVSKLEKRRVWVQVGIGCSRRRNSGFTLLMSVVALAIGVLVLASIARLSQAKAMLARQQLQELQWRWGNHSSQQVLLKNAKSWLEDKEQSLRLLPEREVRFRLGKQDVFARLADENQKLDINTLSLRVSQVQLEKIITGMNDSDLKVQIRNLPNNKRRNLKEGGLECWDQVWELPADPDIQQLVIGSSGLTLWANRVHIQSQDTTLREFGQPFLGAIAIDRLLAARKGTGPDRLLPEIITQADLSPQQADQCRRVFCDQSTSFSMWLTMVNGKRMRSSLTIREGIPVSGDRQVIERVHAFRW